MRKIKLLLATMLCIVGTGMMKADVITSADQLSNSKVYTIKTTRGYMTLNKDQNKIVSTHKRTSADGDTPNDAAATDDASKQFGIFEFNGKYFLYSPKLKQFASLQGQELVFKNDRGTALAITTDGSGNPDGSKLRFFAYKIGSEGYNKWCLNNNNGGSLVLNSYTGSEAGNTVSIEEVANGALDADAVMEVFNGTPAFSDPHKVYNITNKRVKNWTANSENTGLVGTELYTGASNEQQQFVFFKYEGKQYLYNVGAKKFVATDGSLTIDRFEAATIAIWYTGDASYPYCFYIEERGLLFNGQGGTNAGKFSINAWNNGLDDGNKHNLVEVAEADKYDEVLAIFETPSWDVTYNIFMNDVKVASVVRPQDKGSEVALPSSAIKPFCTYTYDQTTITTGINEVNVTATWNGPFVISKDFANAHWYDMAMRNTWYVTSDVKDNDGAYKTQNANTMGLVEDSYQWAFIGNPWAGFKIINKAAGEGKSFGWVDDEAKDKGVPTIMDDGVGNHAWNIIPSTNTTVAAGSFCLNISGTNLSINQYGGAGGSVKFWDSTGNIGDAGSAFTVFDVPTNFASFVVDEIAPVMEATGYFSFTDAAKAEIGYDASKKTECSFADYKSMKENLAAAISNLSNFNLPETGYYILKNKYRETYLGISPSDGELWGNYKTATAAKNIVKLTKNEDNTYTIGLMGKFAPASVTTSKIVIATAEAGNYTIVITTPGYAAFQLNPDVQTSALHCGNDEYIVGWEPASAASQWEVIDAESIEFTIGAEGYATAYLPFPAEFGGTIPLPEPKGVWTFDDANDLLAGTGIATLKATTHAKNNVTETDLATAGITTVDGPYEGNGAVNIPVGSSLLMSANTNATNIGTYTIMYDVCVEDGSTYVPLLQNSLTDGKDGSLFINKNQVGLGAGLGYHGSIENNKWYRIVFAVQPNGASLYVDGVQLVSNLNLPNPYNQHWMLTTGALFFADEDGEEKAIKTSEVRFWDTVLSADQIADLGSATGDAPKFPEAVGSWTFDDATDPYATTGTATLSEVGSATITATDGEVTVPKNAGLELKTNLDNIPSAYTLLLDVKLADVSGFIALFQNDITNSKDASIFINGGKIGLSSAGLGYNGTINPNTWYRIVTVIDNGYCTLYVDGEQVGKSAGKDVNAWTMRETKELMLFTDNDGEEKEVTTSEVRFWNMALTATQIAQLGTVGTTIDDENEKPEYVEPTAYTAVIDGNTHSKWLTLNKLDGIIPTKTAVIIKGTPKTYLYKIAAETAPVDNNDLKGTLEPIEANGKYILAKPQGKEVGFYLAESGKIAAGKAYVELDGNTGPLVKALLFGEEAETAIDNVKANTNTNVNNAAIYNLSGQRINKLQKGINIVNGKKILR